MGRRVQFGALAVLVLVTVVAFDALVADVASQSTGSMARLLSRGSAIPVFFFIVLQLGAWEMVQLFRARGVRPFARFSIMATGILVITPWLSAGEWLGTGPAQVEGMQWIIVVLAASLVGTGLLAMLRADRSGVLTDVAASMLIVLYVGFLGALAVQLRCGRDVAGRDGAWVILMAILITKSADIGAYFTGSFVGRHKLAPTISPGKTIEGAIGGVVFAILCAVVFAFAGPIGSGLGAGSDLRARLEGITDPFFQAVSTETGGSLWPPIVFGLVLSIAGQAGDLLESCFKRDAGTKDSGNVLPRFGGILDLIDSPLLAIPVAWLLVTVV